MQLTTRFDQAVNLACELHRDHLRKGTSIPYVSHLLAVASLVLEQGGDEELAMAAMLHDAVEDRGGQATLQRIRQSFGDRVAGIVAECSDDIPAADGKKAPWRERKQKYLDHLPHASADARLVSAADKLHNARCILADFRQIGDQLWQRFNPAAARDGTLWYYRSLARTFREHGPKALGEELDRIVGEVIRLIGRRIGATQSTPPPVDGKPVLELLVGSIASGKSSWTRNRARAGFVTINSDSLVESMQGGDYRWDHQVPHLRFDLAHLIQMSASLARRHVVVDNTNGSPAQRSLFVSTGREQGMKIRAVIFPREAPQIHARRRHDSDNRGCTYEYWLEVATNLDRHWEDPRLGEVDELVVLPRDWFATVFPNGLSEIEVIDLDEVLKQHPQWLVKPASTP